MVGTEEEKITIDYLLEILNIYRGFALKNRRITSFGIIAIIDHIIDIDVQDTSGSHTLQLFKRIYPRFHKMYHAFLSLTKVR
jgi:hypothetical protein